MTQLGKYGGSLAAALVCLLVAAGSAAQESVSEIVKESDRNHDGRLQLEEAPISLLADFDEIDADSDGSIGSFEAWSFESRKRRERFRAPAPQAAPGRVEPDAAKQTPRTMVEFVKAADRDGDGVLGFDEVAEDSHERLRRFDENGDGFIDLDEAKALDERVAKQRSARPTRRTYVRTLSLMDTDGDGLLQKKEAPLRVQRDFEQIDLNGDGALDPEEAAAADADPPKRRR